MALTGTRLTLRPSTVRLPTASGARERCSAPCSAERARNVAQLLIALLTLFFFYRDGDLLVRQIQRIAKRFFDDRSGSFRSRRWGYEPGGGFTGYSLRHWHKARLRASGIGFLDLRPLLSSLHSPACSRRLLLGTAFI